MSQDHGAKTVHELVHEASRGSGLVMRGRTATGLPFSLLLVIGKPGNDKLLGVVDVVESALQRQHGDPPTAFAGDAQGPAGERP